MRPCEAERTSTCSRKTKNGKKILLEQQPQLITKQINTKNRQYGSS